MRLPPRVLCDRLPDSSHVAAHALPCLISSYVAADAGSNRVCCVADGATVPDPQKLADLKKKYFQKILDDLKAKKSDMLQVSIYDKIDEVDKVAKDIFKDVLENRPGLTAQGSKQEASQSRMHFLVFVLFWTLF